MKPVTSFKPGDIVHVQAPGSVYVGHFVIISKKKMLDIDTGKVISTQRNKDHVHYSGWDGYRGTVREALDAKGELGSVKKAFQRLTK